METADVPQWHCVPCGRDFVGPVVDHADYRAGSAGELAHPDMAYVTAAGHPLMGPCDTPGCVYASKPGGNRHDGYCSDELERIRSTSHTAGRNVNPTTL